MNLKQELAQITLNNENLNQVLGKLEKNEQLDKKGHLLKIAYLAKKIDEKIATGFFINDRFSFLDIWLNRDNNNRFLYSIVFDLLDKDKRLISPFNNGKYNEKIMFFKSLFDEVEENGKINAAFINVDLLSNVQHVLEFNINTGENFLNLFLNSELKKIYDYNNMQVGLPENNIKTSKKIKL